MALMHENTGDLLHLTNVVLKTCMAPVYTRRSSRFGKQVIHVLSSVYVLLVICCALRSHRNVVLAGVFSTKYNGHDLAGPDSVQDRRDVHLHDHESWMFVKTMLFHDTT